MVERELREVGTNNLLLLYLIDETDKRGVMENDLKLQKMTFAAQKKFIERKMKGFSYKFFRWYKGPYSASVSADLDLLINDGVLRREGNKIELTSRGREILRGFSGLLEDKRNKAFTIIIKSIVQEYAAMDAEAVKEKVYAMEVMVPRIKKRMAIRDVPMRQIILFKSSDERVKQIFEINEAWLGILELVLDAEALTLLKKSFDDARQGRVYGFRPL